MPYLAREYDGGLAQWLSEETRADITGHNPLTRFLGLIWHDPAIVPKSPEDLPEFHWFEEQGIAFWRSSWTGNGTVIGIKCSPPGGHHAASTFPYNPGSSHSQPDAGTFLVFGEGRWLVAPPGYTKDRQTAYANTLLINDEPQIGSGDHWLHTDAYATENRHPRITEVRSSGGITRVRCDLTPAYLDPGLSRCERTFFLVDENTWVVVDEIEHELPAVAKAIFHSDETFLIEANLVATSVLGDSEYRATLYPLGSTRAGLSAATQTEWTKHDGKLQKPVLTVENEPEREFGWAVLFQVRKPDEPFAQLLHDEQTGGLSLVRGANSLELVP